MADAGLKLSTGVHFNFTTGEVIKVRRVVSSEPPGTVVRQGVAPGKRVRVGRGVAVALASPAPGPCDPSYPDVCIPPYPPDLDCPQVGYTNIRVVGSDPHDLDRGGEPGVGCET